MQLEESTVATPADIMDALRTGTQKLHDQTESGAFNDALLKGKLPLDSYVDMLGQLLLVHRALERRLRDHRAAHPAIDRVVREHYLQEPYLLDDLAYFGRNPEQVEPLPSVQAFETQMDATAKQNPASLLGYLYVLEGSNNGGRFIARAVRRVYNLPDTHGTRYLDPYGEQQKAFWQEFKADMRSVEFSDADRAAILEAANQMFIAVMRLHVEMYAPIAATKSSGGKCPFHHG